MSIRKPKSQLWRKATLQDLVFFQRGFDITKAEQKEGEVPVISSSGINSFHSEAKVDCPGVIIGRKGSLGTVHFSNGPFWPHDTTLWSKDLKGNNPKYVYYFLQTLNLQNYNVGNANPTLNRNHIHALEIVIPNSDDQEKIASILSAYDELIDNNRRRIQLLEQSARLLYKEWFVHFRFPGHEHVKIVGGLPEGWERKKIVEVAETTGGGTPSSKVPEFWEGDVTWVVPSDITKNDSLILLDSERKITELGLKKSSAKLVPPNTILMTSRASVGYFAVMDQEVCTNQGFINIVPHSEEHRMYFLFNLISRAEEIRSNAKGTTYPEISKGRFREMDITIPNKTLFIEFGKFASDALGQVRNLKLSVQKLTQARDLLLPRLMSGEIPV